MLSVLLQMALYYENAPTTMILGLEIDPPQILSHRSAPGEDAIQTFQGIFTISFQENKKVQKSTANRFGYPKKKTRIGQNTPPPLTGIRLNVRPQRSRSKFRTARSASSDRKQCSQLADKQNHCPKCVFFTCHNIAVEIA